MKALIYTRNSEGMDRSVSEQETEARQVCEREGWEVAEVVTDLVGASRHSKGTRSGWAKVQKLLPERDVLVTWECSRAQRDLAAYADLRDLCAANGVLWSYKGRTYDLTTGADRFTTGLDALLAEREAEETSERVRRAIRANALAGRPHGRRLYGYERTYDPTTGALIGQAPHPAEARVVRMIFDAYLSGVGLRTIARKLEADGVVTGTGARWADAQVRQVLKRPGYAGLRVHQGEIIGEAVWEPLVTRETWDAAQTLLAERRTSDRRITPTARLLSGIVRCGKCGGRMIVIHDRKIRKVYACKERYDVTRDLAKLDLYVSSTLLERLSTVGAGEHPETRDTTAEVQVLRKRLDDAVGEFTAGRLSAGTLARIEGDILPAIAALEQQARRAVLPLRVDLPTGDYRAWWDDELTAEQRREIVRAFIAAVIVFPVGRGKRTFDPSKVKIEWRR